MKLIYQMGAFTITIGLVITLVSCQGNKSNNNTGMAAVLLGLVDQQNKTAAAAAAAKKCETTFTSGVATAQSVCTPSAGRGRHFRLEGFKLNRTENSNGAFYLGFGQDSTITGTTTTPSSTASGKLTVQMYAGSFTGSAPFGLLYGGFSSEAFAVTTDSTTNTSSTYSDFTVSETTETSSTRLIMCVDVSASTPPRVTIWATGKNGADCTNGTNLTTSTAIFNKSTWTTSAPVNDSGAIVAKTASNSTGIYLTKIAVSTETAIK